MSAFFLPNRLFIKLLLGFWLCSSLIIACVGVLPLLQQLHQNFDVPDPIKYEVYSYAEQLKDHPERLTQRFDPYPINDKFRRKFRQELDGIMPAEAPRDDGLTPPPDDHEKFKPIPFYIFVLDSNAQVLNAPEASQGLQHILRDAKKLDQPQSFRHKSEVFFGPVKVSLASGDYSLYGALHLPRHIPWFFFFIEHKLLTLALAIITSGILCAVLAWHLGKPLHSLQQGANALARGDLNSRVSDATANRHDELGDLAKAFNLMADAVEQMVKSQQRLIGDISHELRTPLTRLQLALALARKKGSAIEETERIAYEADQLEQMIAELLELSRVKLKHQDSKINLPLEELLSQVLDDGEFEASQQGKQLCIDIPEELECAVYPKPLSRAIENLLRNAIRYSHNTINIRARLQQQEVNIVIDDDGNGIEEQELEAIFKPFYRPESARDRESGGWGLGLAITEAAITAHRGRIIARNKPEGGLEVSLWLPIS
ncbi:histidine kinase [Shewanella mangrovi]|uniref:histidine kinase n=1 Tax=Shewanella mangrovi TaxID=1515746 RepID=A0A094JZ04_9GAMM|nr:ATP-binding protein [Shewanella mangrovi]KFZ37671.1 histidine kinase [Shewanella mangrovi]